MKDFTITHIGESELSLPMPFKYIPAKGKTFMFQADDGSNLGNKSEGVPITFENDFWMCVYQTTQEFGDLVVNLDTLKQTKNLGLKRFKNMFNGKMRPLDYVTWPSANMFLNFLNYLKTVGDLKIHIQDNINELSGKFILPSESQWEYAAISNQKTLFSGSNNLNDIGWYSQNTNDCTMPVGLKQPNSFGLYDMSGNIWEWCADNYSHFSEVPKNGEPYLERELFKSLRGGKYLDEEKDCSIKLRAYHPDYSQGTAGFRMCFSLNV